MDFYIKQNATLPILKVKVSKDGRSDFGSFLQILSSSTIYYSMVDIDTGIPKITNRYLNYVFNEAANGVSPSEVYLYVKFAFKDTKKPGKYKIQFFIQDGNGTIALPLIDDVFIIITESFILDGASFSDNFVINNPCCSRIEELEPYNFLITQDGDKIKTEDGYFIIVIV